MENFYIQGEEFIPEVNFDVNKGHLSISGESYHEYTHEFFDPILEWLENYLDQPDLEVVFDFKMTYFNTASSKRLLDIIDLLKDYDDSEAGNVTVNWYYKESDMDMFETGEEYIDDTGMDLNLVAY